MAVVFDATVGGAAATSAVSLAFALQFAEDKAPGGQNAFTRLVNPDDQRRVLNRACAELERLEPKLAGTRASSTQALSQPRINAYRDACASYVKADVVAGTAIAIQWQQAQCIRAFEMADADEKAAADATSIGLLAPFSEFKAAGVEMKMREPKAPTTKLSDAVRELVSIFKKSAGGLLMVRQ